MARSQQTTTILEDPRHKLLHAILSQMDQLVNHMRALDDSYLLLGTLDSIAPELLESTATFIETRGWQEPLDFRWWKNPPFMYKIHLYPAESFLTHYTTSLTDSIGPTGPAGPAGSLAHSVLQAIRERSYTLVVARIKHRYFVMLESSDKFRSWSYFSWLFVRDHIIHSRL
jgi:hypothetical protein